MNTTMHPVAPEEIMAFLDDELSADRTSAISAHVNSCRECHEMAESFSMTSQSLSNWMVGTVPLALDDDVLEVLSSVGKPWDRTLFSVLGRFLRRQSVLAWGGAALAALFILVGISSMNIGVNSRGKLDRASPDSIRASRTHGAEQQAARGQGSLGKLETPGIAEEGDSQYFGDALRPAEKDRNQVSRTLPGPMIARTVSLAVVVKDFDAGRAALEALLARHHGYAAGLNVSTPQGAARTLQASLRIPAPQLAAALAELKVLGRVEAETQNGEEVTSQHGDLVARIKNDRETETRLQDILRTRTGKVKDVLEVENEIARVRGEIEQLEAEQKTLEHRVDFASIDLKLAEEYKAQLSSPAPSVVTQLRNSTINGFRNAFESLMTLVLFIAEWGPTLLLWVLLLGFPAWLLWRRYRGSLALGSTIGA
jgi:hypothetical protein